MINCKMNNLHFGFAIFSFLMIFTTGFAYGASYDGIDRFRGGVIEGDEL